MDSQDEIEALVTERTGIVIRDKDRRNFESTIRARLRATELDGPGYRLFLKQGGPGAAEEWERLHFALTVGESYFFRDQGQMDLIRDVVFPALLRENKPDRKLRIWSAGCSTGEEPYSLAMILDDMLGDENEWNVQILATDINKHALDKARLGVYGEWSFRKMDEARRDRYFKRIDQEWELEERIRSMVSFREVNLAALQLPDPARDLSDIDFIFCRNVFIYFGRETVERIANDMARGLRPGGYFLAGHGELYNLTLPDLRLEMHPGSVIHRKLEIGAARSVSEKPKPVVVPTPSQTAPSQSAPGSPPRPPLAPIQDNRPAPTARPVERATPSATSLPGSPRPPSASESRTKAPLTPPTKKPAPPAAAPETVGKQDLEPLEDLLRARRYRELITRIGPRENYASGDPVLYLAARALANLGEHEQALEACRRASQGAERPAEIMVLEAQILEESGQARAALEILRQALYLTPDYIPGYLEMAAAYDREGDSARARKQRQTALGLLKKLNSGTEIDRYEGTTAGELALGLEGLLSRSDE